MLIRGKEPGLCALRVALANKEKSLGEGGPVSTTEQHSL